MKLKMAFIMLAISALCLGLCACGDNAAGSSSSASDSASASTSASSTESTSASSVSSSSGSASEASHDEGFFVGTWEMAAMSDGTDVFTIDNVDEETRASIDMGLELNADGSMVLHNMGTDMKGTWKLAGGDTLQLDFEDTADFKDISYTAFFADDMIAIEDAGLVMMFEKAA